MGTTAAFLLTTVDGCVEGPDREFDFWAGLDDEFTDFSCQQLDAAAGLLLGRVTYEGMAAYWQSAAAHEQDPRTQARMQRLPKLVASTTLSEAAWPGTEVVRSVEEIASVTSGREGETLVLGSPTLTTALARRSLLDELRVMVSPVAVGAGRSLFRADGLRLPLALLGVRTFASGTVLLTYRPA